MEENNSYHLRSLTLAVAGGILMSLCLALLLRHPIPMAKRLTSPGFGWSWDFDYESAMTHHAPISDDAPTRSASPDSEALALPLDAKVAVAGLVLIYRGTSGSEKFRLDVIIPALDPNFAYAQELKVKEACQELRLSDERFKVTAISPHRLELRHLSP